jgi:hypothetical protein
MVITEVMELMCVGITGQPPIVPSRIITALQRATRRGSGPRRGFGMGPVFKPGFFVRKKADLTLTLPFLFHNIGLGSSFIHTLLRQRRGLYVNCTPATNKRLHTAGESFHRCCYPLLLCVV